MSWTLAFTAISALTTVGSTIMSIQQARQNQKQIKANAAWEAYNQKMELEIEKQRRLREQVKLMSEQRAKIGMSGIQFTGSPLLAVKEDYNDFLSDMHNLARVAQSQSGSLDVETQGLLANETSNMIGAIAEGVGSLASTGMKYKQTKALGINL
jgi:Holliday junction resolvase